MREVMREPLLTHYSFVEVLVCVVCCVFLSSCCHLEVLLFSNFLLLCVVYVYSLGSYIFIISQVQIY